MLAEATDLSSKDWNRSRHLVPSCCVEHAVHLGRGQRWRLALELGQRLAVGLAVLLGNRRFHHRQGLADLHRAALELAEHGEQLLGGLVHHLGVDLVLRLAGQPLSEARVRRVRPSPPAATPAWHCARRCPRLISLTSPSSTTATELRPTSWQRRSQQRALRVPGPSAGGDRRRAATSNSSVVSSVGGSWVAAVTAHRAHDVVDLVAAPAPPSPARWPDPRCRRCGTAAPRRAGQAASRSLRCRSAQRRQLVAPGITSGPISPVPSRTRTGRCANAGVVQFAHHPWVGDQVVGQHDEIGARRSTAWVLLLWLTRTFEQRSDAVSRSDSGPSPCTRIDAARAWCRGAAVTTPALDEVGEQTGDDGRVDAVSGGEPLCSSAVGHGALQRAQQRRPAAAADSPAGGWTTTARRGSQPDLHGAVGPGQHRGRRVERVARHASTVSRRADPEPAVIHRRGAAVTPRSGGPSRRRRVRDRRSPARSRCRCRWCRRRSSGR